MRFPQDYTREQLIGLVLLHRDASIEANTKLTELREKLIKTSQELSSIKKLMRDKP
jgi:hypothetical protein